MGVLDYNPEAVADQKFEYLRLRLAPRNAQGIHAAAFQSRPAAVRVSQLPANVTTNEDGDVFIPGIPMVDQGPKGYCVVASVQRLFEYYGIPATSTSSPRPPRAMPISAPAPMPSPRCSARSIIASEPASASTP